ncbi:unnamed protein product [Phytomonas sp. Hart1]|nr:unnamed protein product [Phytomonas sp. Hart1]|eukprot:CCW66149.1 unnamed protein product [Phytomonas sp. isolate Hart1]
MGILNSIVFQPQSKESDILFTYLCRVKRYMSYVPMPTGECLYYIHIENNEHGGRSPSEGTSTPWTQNNDIPNSGEGGVESPPRKRNNFVILYSHGNAEHLGICYNILRWLSILLQVDIIGYDYRGYGFSKNPQAKTPFGPTESSVYVDADCIYEQVLALGYHPSQIFLMGRSLGGGPACYLAEKHHQSIAGLILESTFSSCIRVVSASFLPFCFGWLDMFRNVDRIKTITGCPILFIHGKKDNVVPIRCSQLLMLIALKKRQPPKKKKIQTKRTFLSWLGCASVGASDPALEPQRRSSSSKLDGSPNAKSDPKDHKEGCEIDPACKRMESFKIEDPQLHPLRLMELHSLETSVMESIPSLLTHDGEENRPNSPSSRRISLDQCKPSSKGPHSSETSKTLDPKRADQSTTRKNQKKNGSSVVGGSVASKPAAPSNACAPVNFSSRPALSDSLEENLGMRLDEATSTVIRTKEEEMGIFHHWFEDCGHNDIETRSTEHFFLALNRFIKYASVLKKSKAHKSAKNSPFHLDMEEMKPIQ